MLTSSKIMMSSTPKKFFGTFSWYTAFPQSFKSLSLLEQKLGRGMKISPQAPKSPGRIGLSFCRHLKNSVLHENKAILSKCKIKRVLAESVNYFNKINHQSFT